MSGKDLGRDIFLISYIMVCYKIIVEVIFVRITACGISLIQSFVFNIITDDRSRSTDRYK